MRILRFDSVGGASGDMVLAALSGLGADLQAVREDLASLGVETFRIDAEAVIEGSLTGTRVTVTATEPHKGHGRHLSDIRRLLDAARLTPRAREVSLRVFERLAEAEAKVHGTTPEHIHFHEVGALDSIVDIVGACDALDRLAVDAVSCGPLPQGQGVIRAAHGVLPNPPPAVVELLQGFAVQQTGEPYELVTPTGAALLTTWQSLTHPPPPRMDSLALTALASANAFGHRRLDQRPNLLRARLMETAAAPAGHDACVVLECNLDDTVPEWVGALVPALLAAGALDAYTTAVQMKKQRPGTLLTVLCRPAERDALLDLIFRESTTFGIREHVVQRTILERRVVETATAYGTVRVKIGTWRGRDVTRSPEHDDCARCAREHGVAVRVVYDAALRTVPG